jgi:hypothetical protein
MQVAESVSSAYPAIQDIVLPELSLESLAAMDPTPSFCDFRQ